MNAFLKRGFLAAGLTALVLTVGCAHPISVNPSDTASIRATSPARIEKAVAYYVSPEDMKLEVTTPGGGGDKVSYFPYRDLDPSIYQALTQVFTSVIKIETPTAAGRPVQLVLTPKLLTNSSSASPFTWPPTDFSVELTCKVTDGKGAPVTSIVVTGTGKAEFSEFKSDFSLAARRASFDAMNKLVKALEAAPELRR